MGCLPHPLSRAELPFAPASIIQPRMVPRRNERRFGPGNRGIIGFHGINLRGCGLRPCRFPIWSPAGREIGWRFVSNIYGHNAGAFVVRFMCIHHRIIWTGPPPSGVHPMRNQVKRSGVHTRLGFVTGFRCSARSTASPSVRALPGLVNNSWNPSSRTLPAVRMPP